MKGRYEIGAPLPKMPASYARFCVVGGKIYGIYNEGMHIYDPKTDSWEAVENPKTWDLRYVKEIAAVDEKIYVLQARSGSISQPNTCWMYDTLNKSWHQIGDRPSNVVDFGIAVVGKKIYCIGGRVNSSTMTQVDICDTQTNTWTSGVPLPTSVGLASCAVMGKRIHCIGGMKSAGIFDGHYCFDLDTQVWTNENTTAFPSHQLSTFRLQDKICCVVGDHKMDNFYIYNEENKIWEKGPNSPLSFELPQCVPMNDKLYIFEGYVPNPVITEIFTPEGSEPGPEPEPPVTSGVLRLALRVGQSQRLAGLQLPEGVTLEGLSWESGNPGIATVSDVGVVTGVSLGLATIIATSADKSWSGKILVQVCGEDERLSILLEIGESCQLLAWGDGGAVTWVSGKEAIATVSTTGQVLAVSAGVTPITATDSHGRMDTLYVKVEGAE